MLPRIRKIKYENYEEQSVTDIREGTIKPTPDVYKFYLGQMERYIQKNIHNIIAHVKKLRYGETKCYSIRYYKDWKLVSNFLKNHTLIHFEIKLMRDLKCWEKHSNFYIKVTKKYLKNWQMIPFLLEINPIKPINNSIDGFDRIDTINRISKIQFGMIRNINEICHIAGIDKSNQLINPINSFVNNILFDKNLIRLIADYCTIPKNANIEDVFPNKSDYCFYVDFPYIEFTYAKLY